MYKHNFKGFLISSACFMSGIYISWKLFGPKAALWYRFLEEYREKYQLMSLWMKKREQGKTINRYLIEHRVTSVAIYGLGETGQHLLHELVEEKTNIRYVIDRKCKVRKYGIPVYDIEQELEPVDLIIVTPIQAYEEIRRDIMARVSYPVTSIEEIIYGL